MNDAAHNPERPSEDELKRMIRCLRPDSEVFSGRIFFMKLLEYKGVEGVYDFIERSKAALLTQTDLDLHYNFDPVEREIFKKTYLKAWSRREFLNTFGWGVPGAVFAAYGTTGMIEQVDDYRRRGSVLPENFERMSRPRQWKERVLTAEPAAEVLIGAALVNEGFEKWDEIKLEQIADAVDVLGKRLQIQTKLETASR